MESSIICSVVLRMEYLNLIMFSVTIEENTEVVAVYDIPTNLSKDDPTPLCKPISTPEVIEKEETSHKEDVVAEPLVAKKETGVPKEEFMVVDVKKLEKEGDAEMAEVLPVEEKKIEPKVEKLKPQSMNGDIAKVSLFYRWSEKFPTPTCRWQ